MVTEIGPGIAANEALGTTYAALIAYCAVGNADPLYVGRSTTRSCAPPLSRRRSGRLPHIRDRTGYRHYRPPAAPHTAMSSTRSTSTRRPMRRRLERYHRQLAHAAARCFTGRRCADLQGGSVIVGTNAGVFAATRPAFTWSRLVSTSTVPGPSIEGRLCVPCAPGRNTGPRCVVLIVR